MRNRLVIIAFGAFAWGAAARPCAAQQWADELHANYARATQSRTSSWGAGGQIQATWGAKQAIALNTSLGLDYLKQEKGGPSEWNVSYDAVLQPGGGGTVTPYAGGSVGANWSTGDAKQWEGARFGTELLGGVQVKLGSATAVHLEERFGYVRGEEHSLTSRFGFIVQM